MANIVNWFLENQLSLVDYRLFYIVMASFLIGRNQSIISVGLAIVWYLYQNILNGQDIITQLTEHNTLVNIGLYIFTGLTLGYVIDKKERLIRSSRAEVVSVQEKYQSLTTVLEDALTVKEELQNQVLYTNNSIASVCSIMKDLDSLDSKKIISSSVGVVENVMKSAEAAVYLLDQSQEKLILAAKSSKLVIADMMVIDEFDFLKEAMETNGVLVNKRLNPSLPSMVAPIFVEGNLEGFVCLYNPEFEYLTLSYQNQFQVTANLVSSALKRAHEHEQLLFVKNQKKNKHFNNKEEAYV